MIIATHGIVASQILTVPVATAATSVGESSFTANWNAYTGASYYLLDVSLNSSFSSYVLQDQVTTSTSYVVTGLSSNTTYYYRIRANVGTDPDAQAFFDRVTTAGGSLSATEQTAIDTLVIQMKSDGIWTKMKAIYPMVGASSAACAQNLKSSSFTGSFSSGWTFASTGVTPNGTSAFMDTNLTPSVSLSTNNFSLSYYSRTNSNANVTVFPTDIGSYAGSAGIGVFLYRPSLTPKGGGGGYAIEVGNNSITSSTYYGLVTRTSTTLQKFIRNGVILNTDTTLDTGTRPNLSITLGKTNGFSNFADRQCAFAHIGDGLTDTEASNLYTAVQAFQTTLSRNV